MFGALQPCWLDNKPVLLMESMLQMNLNGKRRPIDRIHLYNKPRYALLEAPQQGRQLSMNLEPYIGRGGLALSVGGSPQLLLLAGLVCSQNFYDSAKENTVA